MQAETNMSTFQELGVKRIVASCPHCFHTLGKEYADYGGADLEVFHHSEILAKLQEEGKLPQAEKNGSVTFHDPCYLGRIGGIVEEPRNLIGGLDVEPERHGNDSFCCGAGGAQMWMEEDSDKRVNQIRAKEIAATGCDTVAVGCHFCSVMVKDGLDAVGAEMDVKDVAEILWEQIVARDEEIHAAASAGAAE
jgi:Fe-S oxidoreductase